MQMKQALIDQPDENGGGSFGSKRSVIFTNSFDRTDFSEASALTRCQTPIQAFLRPSECCLGLRYIRRVHEEWTIESNPEDVCDVIYNIFDYLTAEERLSIKSHYIVNIPPSREHGCCHQSASCGLHVAIHLITPYNWLDTLDICIYPNGKASNLDITLASTGLCPMMVRIFKISK